MFVSLREACPDHGVTQAAFFENGLFKGSQLFTENIVNLMDQVDHDVGDCSLGTLFDIGPLGFIRLIFFMSQFTHRFRCFTVLIPQLQIVHSQKIP